MRFAFRDAFGIQDLIQDMKATFRGERYEYRSFDAQDDVITHEESDSRTARMLEGMRYSRNGKGKYWLPKPRGANARTPLLGGHGPITEGGLPPTTYNATSDASSDSDELYFEDLTTDENQLYEGARALEYGDWNYPVITAHIPSKNRWYHGDEPSIITTSTNRHLLHPAHYTRKRLKKQTKGKNRSNSPNESSLQSRAPIVADLICRDSQESNRSGRSQLVDLIVEDTAAEEIEKVRARKEGGPEWNIDQPTHFV